MKRTVIACYSDETKEKNLELCCSKIDAENSSPKAIIFFSELEDLWFYAKMLKEKYPDTISIGTSSYTFFSSEGFAKKGLTVMAINYGVECSCGLLFEVGRYPKNYKQHIKNAIKQLPSTENTCCIEFTTAFSRGEELVLDTFDSVLKGTGIPVLGASSGNEKGVTETAVALNGDIYANTCAFIFIHNLNGKIIYGYENIFKKTDQVLTATDVDCDERKVYMFNNKPAIPALCETYQVTPPELQKKLSRAPLGRIFKDQIYITALDEISQDGSISFFARIYNLTKLAVMEIADFFSTWTKTAQGLLSEMPEPSFTICLNCLSRTVLFEEENQMSNFVSKLSDFYGNIIGMSGYGEQMNLMHLNQTMILVLFE